MRKLRAARKEKEKTGSSTKKETAPPDPIHHRELSTTPNAVYKRKQRAEKAKLAAAETERRQNH